MRPARISSSWLATASRASVWFAIPEPGIPMRSISPEACTGLSVSVPSSLSSRSWYFSEDEPALITKMSIVLPALLCVCLRLDGGDGNGVDDVIDRGTPGEVIDRFISALQHGTNGDGASRLLHGLIRVVTGVEVGEDKYGGMTGHFCFGHLGGRHRCRDGGVILQWPLDFQLGPVGPYELGGFSDFVHIGTATGFTGGIRQHCHPRGYSELFGGFG